MAAHLGRSIHRTQPGIPGRLRPRKACFRLTGLIHCCDLEILCQLAFRRALRFWRAACNLASRSA